MNSTVSLDFVGTFIKPFTLCKTLTWFKALVVYHGSTWASKKYKPRQDSKETRQCVSARTDKTVTF